MKKKIYTFGLGKDKKAASLGPEILGGKGHGLVRMAADGYPVPPGMVITTEAFTEYKNSDNPAEYIESLAEQVVAEAHNIDKKLGEEVLFSVRSGARVSMPGMMDTILNVGMLDNAEDFESWAEKMGRVTALDCYRRFLEMFGEVVCGIDAQHLHTDQKYIESMTEESLGKIIKHHTNVFEITQTPLPKTVQEQFERCIEAVFHSWDNPRAKEYRKMHGYPDHWGTAVVIQAMVLGNLNDQSGSGVLFSRDPATGEDTVIGEWLPNAQGEDVVAGTSTPRTLSDMIDWNPDIHAQLFEVAESLEKDYKDMVDIEFTIQNGELFILQSRVGKRSAQAAFRIIKDMMDAKELTVTQARKRVTAAQFLALKERKIADSFTDEPDGVGIPAGGSVVCGKAVFTSKDAVIQGKSEPVVLIAKETTPNDISGMDAAVGIVTTTGGSTSHAAVVARAMDKTAVVGFKEGHVKHNRLYVGYKYLYAGKYITLNGKTGEVWLDKAPIEQGAVPPYARELVQKLAAKEGLALRAQRLDHEEDNFFMDTAWFSAGDMASDLTKLIDHNRKNVKNHFVIDLNSKYGLLDNFGQDYYGLIGINPKKEAMAELDLKLAALGLVDNKDGIILLLPQGTTQKTAAQLKKEGYALARDVATVADMLSGDPVMVTDKFISDVAGGATAYKNMMALFHKGGFELNILPSGKTEEDMAYALFS